MIKIVIDRDSSYYFSVIAHGLSFASKLGVVYTEYEVQNVNRSKALRGKGFGSKQSIVSEPKGAVNDNADSAEGEGGSCLCMLIPSLTPSHF